MVFLEFTPVRIRITVAPDGRGHTDASAVDAVRAAHLTDRRGTGSGARRIVAAASEALARVAVGAGKVSHEIQAGRRGSAPLDLAGGPAHQYFRFSLRRWIAQVVGTEARLGETLFQGGAWIGGCLPDRAGERPTPPGIDVGSRWPPRTTLWSRIDPMQSRPPRRPTCPLTSGER